MKYLVLLIFAFAFSAKSFAKQLKLYADDSLMITIFLKHQQDKSLSEIQKKEEENKFWEMFPPKQSRVVSWYVMMGVGQVVTVKIAAKDLRTLNLSIEKGAWGAFSTEFYPTYDYVPIWQEQMEKKGQNKQ